MAGLLEFALDAFELRKFLGAGFEGKVFAASRDGQRYTLKVFHQPWNKDKARNLIVYSERVGPNDAGFFPVNLITDNDFILGLYYEYMPLFRLPFSGRFSERITQALLAQYCYSQAYLLREHGLYMVDDAMQFLLSEEGGLYYVDYGKRIVRREDEFFLARGYAPFSFLEALFRLNGVAIDRSLIKEGFNYGVACSFVSPELFDTLERDHPWTSPVIDVCRNAKGEEFLDHSFHEQIAGMFPRKVENARLLVLTEKRFLFPIRVLRAKMQWSHPRARGPAGWLALLSSMEECLGDMVVPGSPFG